ncbi:uncharacterized protein LOC129918125 [Episyrphus balteatus]|uniref:uncharacterized protein LOC129918125 n=1 Tax=Episyrphus balteatus TaxID=286459 RepID=UPI0024866031|nr:uncharacterized protein LOC129918125 [Episyrphus balteatus]
MMFNNNILVAFLALFIIAELLKTEAESDSKFLSFIENINKVENFESVFLYKSSQDHFFSNFDDKFIKGLSSSLNLPVILTTESSSFYLKAEFNENLLTIVQFNSSDLFLQRLLEHLQHLRFCKTIFVMKNSSRNDLKLKSLFNFCWDNRMVNVLAIFADFLNTLAYYNYININQLKIEEFIWNEKDSDIFPDRMQNLNGLILPVIFAEAHPGVIISKNSNTIIGGHVGHIYTSFAKRHNAQLEISYGNSSISLKNIDNLVLDGKMEMSGSMLMFSQFPIEWFSYPFAAYDWGVMLPIEPKIPVYKVRC